MNPFVRKIIGSASVCVFAIGLGVLPSPAQTAMDLARLPLWFEAGQGQSSMTARFAAHGPDSAFFVTETNAQFVLRKRSGETAAVCMQFVGANSAAPIAGEAEMLGKVNYLLGNDPSQWRSGVPVFTRVRVNNLYPGVDVVYYGNGRQLEYDFDLAAGVDPKTIAIRFDGAEKISVNAQGELIVSLNGGEIIQHRPMVYQNTQAIRREIGGGYQILDAQTVVFALGTYDHSLPLVIDPILSYSTYFGGNAGGIINAIALGTNDDSVYVAGQTLSTVFTNALISTNPPSGYQTNFQGGASSGDAFVAKFDRQTGTTIYFTYLGGSADDTALGLAVDYQGQAFVTGYTDSPNFPHTTNAYQTQIAGAYGSDFKSTYPTDAFVTILSANGSALVYSTFLGGNHTDVGNAIAVDTNDNAYVVGYTISTNFPVTPDAYSTNLLCTQSLYLNANVFLVEIAKNGASLNYASFFGGQNLDIATGIALDNANNIYVAGYTTSVNFPVTNALPTNKLLNGSGASGYDAFVAKFSPGFKKLIYSTFLGGVNSDWANGIAVDTNGNAYVTGATASPTFTNTPTTLTSCVLTNTAGVAVVTNAFLTKIGSSNGTNTFVWYSVVFGGVGYDVASGVAVDDAGIAYVVGEASSTNFPVTTNNLAGFLKATNSSLPGLSDIFVTAIYTNGAPIYSAYLGGAGDDYGNAIAVDSLGIAYVAGSTSSTNFPLINTLATAFAGPYDGFLAKILLTSLTATLAAPAQVIAGHTFPIKASGTEPGGSITNFALLFGTNILLSQPTSAAQINFNGDFGYDFPGSLNFTVVATDNNGVQAEAYATVANTTLPLLHLDGIGFQSNSFKLLMLGQTGTNYQILANTNLASTNWISLGIMQNTNGIWRFFDPTATNFPHRFYRASQLP